MRLLFRSALGLALVALCLWGGRRIYVKVQEDEGISFVKSKIADITESDSGEVTLTGEDTLKGERFQASADLVVLATGVVPSKPGVELKTDDYGFLLPTQEPGHYPAGCAIRPNEVSSTVQDATAAALRACIPTSS